MKTASSKYELFDLGKFLKAKFDANGKQKQDNTNLGRCIYEFLICYKAKCMRANNDACKQETYNGHQLESITEISNEGGKNEKQRYLGEERRDCCSERHHDKLGEWAEDDGSVLNA